MSSDSQATGFRFGTKPSHYPAGGEWVHVYGQHPAYATIRKSQSKLDQVDAHLLKLESGLQKGLDMIRYLRALLIGGHVRQDKLAAVSEILRPDQEPAEALAAAIEAVKDLK